MRQGEKNVEACEWVKTSLIEHGNVDKNSVARSQLDPNLLVWWHSEERLKEDLFNRDYKDVVEVQRNLARLQAMRWRKMLKDDDPDVRAAAETSSLALLEVWCDRFTWRKVWHAIIPKSKEKMNVADAPVTVVEWIKDGGVTTALEAKVSLACGA